MQKYKNARVSASPSAKPPYIVNSRHTGSYWVLHCRYKHFISIIITITTNAQVKQLENVLLGYLSALAFYKFFYILNWVHRYYNEVRLNMKRGERSTTDDTEAGKFKCFLWGASSTADLIYVLFSFTAASPEELEMKLKEWMKLFGRYWRCTHIRHTTTVPCNDFKT